MLQRMYPLEGNSLFSSMVQRRQGREMPKWPLCVVRITRISTRGFFLREGAGGSLLIACSSAWTERYAFPTL